jgi:hypothetical protein
MSPLTDSVKKWFRDAAERALRAAVGSFCAVMLSGSVFSMDGVADTSIVQRAAIAGLGAAASVVLSLAAKWAGDPTNASFQS